MIDRRADADFRPRHPKAELEEALATERIVNLIGPRQVGKTTLVRDLFDRGRFITLDDQATLAAVARDPVGQLINLTADRKDQPLIIGEAQRSKKLSLAIKRAVDANRRKGQVVLTGSSNVFTTAEVTDSLAGRMRTIKLWPLTVAEIKRRPASRLLDLAIARDPRLERNEAPERLGRAEHIELMLAGGLPETRELPVRPRQRQYRNYVDALVDRDVADVSEVRKSDQLRRLIDQMAVRTAQELNVGRRKRLQASRLDGT